VRWLAGEPAARAAALRGLDAGDARVLHESVPRRILRLEAPGEQVLLVKHYRVGSGIHPFRERARALLRRGPADREWRALVTLAGQRVPVPRPLALGVLPDGDRLLVMQHVSGQPLREALAGGRHARWQILSGLGASVAAFHACGYVHGDLHHGNVLATAGGPVLLDLQRVRKARSAAARIRDLAHLDHSLAAFLSTSDRVRVRAAALGITRPFDAAARAALRAVGRASDRRARVHAASRRRHALRDGRAYARVGLDGARGLRALALPETAVAAALAAHGAALAAADARVLENDARGALCTLEVGGHRLVSKEAHVRSVARAVADLWRGSPARRAWAAGHGLEVLGVGAAAPLGYLEWRRFGLPVRSIVLLEDLRPDEGAHRVLESAPPAARAAALDALLGLVLRLHRAGVDHGDLKASHVLLRPSARGFEPRLIDLEGVRFAARLSDRRRVRALAQLNASIGDALEAPARCRFFARYAQALRFEAGAQATRSEIVRESLARRHRWTGRGCAETP
jgi:tRNA A-37 threonylcarbamoyl transferase component Bud32